MGIDILFQNAFHFKMITVLVSIAFHNYIQKLLFPLTFMIAGH